MPQNHEQSTVLNVNVPAGSSISSQHHHHHNHNSAKTTVNLSQHLHDDKGPRTKRGQELLRFLVDDDDVVGDYDNDHQLNGQQLRPRTTISSNVE